jgi:hypothetical protein
MKLSPRLFDRLLLGCLASCGVAAGTLFWLDRQPALQANVSTIDLGKLGPKEEVTRTIKLSNWTFASCELLGYEAG